MTGDGAAAAVTNVVRAGGRWWSAPLGGADPVELSPEQVAGLAGPAGPARRRLLRRDDRPRLAPDAVVAPVPAVVLRADGAGLVATGAGGTDRRLDGGDAELLAAVTGEVAVRDLVTGLAPDDAARRLAVLVEVAALRLVDAPVATAAPGPGPAAGRRADRPPVTAIPRRADDDRVAVYSVWHPEVGPLLSLAMLTAAARHHDGGALNDRYDIRPPETAASFLADLPTRTGPVVLFCSDYVFTLDANLATARRARELRPDLVVVHGGPSAPKYDEDVERFLDEHGDVAHVLVRGEGERTVCELLEALDGTLPAIDHDRLAEVAGLSFRRLDGTTVRTADRERIAELDSLPSPFLTGEFDHIAPEEWSQPPFFETTRGCPYGCTFCDWGSATQSRIRKFDLDRVAAEFEWAASRGLTGAYLCDANFGILPRDVEVAERLAATRRRHGVPEFVMFTPAKNTTRHLTRILDVCSSAGIAVATSISLQSTDDVTLDAVRRHNISTDAYVELAADLRRRGHALTGDLILGMPGQTYESFRSDVQFMLDHEIMPRIFTLRLLPNAPMNAPEYRAEHGIVADDRQVVVATDTLSTEDRERCLRLRKVEAIAERYGVLRHVMRYLQWDHGIPATDLMDAVLDVTDGAGGGGLDHAAGGDVPYPALTWLFSWFDLFPVPASGWDDVYDDVRRLVADRFGIDSSPGWDTALRVQRFLMPTIGRRIPDAVDLDHDYVAWFLSATAELYRSGRAGTPDRPLAAHGPGRLEVTGDPLGLCAEGLSFVGDSRDLEMEGDFIIGSLAANELESPLVRLLPPLGGRREVVERKLRSAMGPSALLAVSAE